MPACTVSTSKYFGALPSNVKVGPITYAIRVQDNLMAKDDDGEDILLFGKVCFATCEITIDSNLAPAMQWQTLWHEIVHIVYDQLGLNKDEGEADGIAYKLLEVLMDNGFLQFPTLETYRGVGDVWAFRQ